MDINTKQQLIERILSGEKVKNLLTDGQFDLDAATFTELQDIEKISRLC